MICNLFLCGVVVKSKPLATATLDESSEEVNTEDEIER